MKKAKILVGGKIDELREELKEIEKSIKWLFDEFDGSENLADWEREIERLRITRANKEGSLSALKDIYIDLIILG